MVRRLIALRRAAPAVLLAAMLVAACGGSKQVVVQTVYVTASPTPTPTPSPTPQASPANVITNAVTARDAQGDNFDPVGITDTFAANQSIFHAVVTITDAPKNTSVKVVWLTSDGTRMGAYTLTSEGSRNLDFTFKPDAGHLPAGQYRAQVYVDDALNRTLTFSVGGGQPTTGGSGIITKVTMAQGVQGAAKDPANPTTRFQPDSVFHAVTAIKDAPANTVLKAAWYVVDVGSASAPNTLIDSTQVTTDGSRNIDFTLAPKTTWPPGTYRVDISVNGAIDQSVQFTVVGSN